MGKKSLTLCEDTVWLLNVRQGVEMGKFEARGTKIKPSEEFKMFPTDLGCAGFVSARGEPQAGSSVDPSSNLGWASFNHNPEQNDEVKDKIIPPWFVSVPLGHVWRELKRVAVRGKLKTLKIPISFLLGCSCAQRQQLLLGHSFCWQPSKIFIILIIIIISPQNEIISQHLLGYKVPKAVLALSRKNYLFWIIQCK